MRRFCTGCKWWVHIKSDYCSDYSFWYCQKYKTTNYTKRRIMCGGRDNEED